MTLCYKVAVQRVAIIATASGSGKTTLARELAGRLGVPHVEIDALHHGPGWTDATAEELRARIEPHLRGDGWVVDGVYTGKLGTLVLDAADTIVWIDLPLRVWLPRLVRRTVLRIARREELWNGNRESLRGALVGRDALIPFALRNVRRRRRAYPALLAGRDHLRLHSDAEIQRFLDGIG